MNSSLCHLFIINYTLYIWESPNFKEYTLQIFLSIFVLDAIYIRIN